MIKALIPISNSVLGTPEQKQSLQLSQADRTRHTYIIGASGEGKSTLLRSLIKQDAENGAGLCVIDPHGQADDSLVDKVIRDLPSHRVKDVILLDVNAWEKVFGLNLFFCKDPNNPKAIQDTVSSVFNIFERIYSMERSATIRINMYIRALVYLFIHNPQLTILDVPKILDPGAESDALRNRLIASLPARPDYEFTRNFWYSYVEKRNYASRNDESAGVFNKFQELSGALMWAIFAQNKNTVDMLRVMNESKILLVKLNADWNDITTLVGGVLIAQIKDATFSRCETSPPFYLYADEFQRMATKDFMQLWTEARKGNLGVTVAHQTLSQVEEDILKTAFTARTQIYFRVSGVDAERLAKNIPLPEPRPMGQPRLEPLRTPVKKPIEHMLEKGVHPLNATRGFIDSYGNLLVEGTKQEENAARRYQSLADRLTYSTSEWRVMPPELPEYPQYSCKWTLAILNNLFYNAMLFGKEEKNPDEIEIADTIGEYFIRATYSPGIAYLNTVGRYSAFYQETFQTYIQISTYDYKSRKRELQNKLTLLPVQASTRISALYRKRDRVMKHLRRAYKNYLLVEAHVLEDPPWWTTDAELEVEVIRRLHGKSNDWDREYQFQICTNTQPYLQRIKNALSLFHRKLWQCQQDIKTIPTQIKTKMEEEASKLQRELFLLTEIEKNRGEYETSLKDIKAMLHAVMRELAVGRIEEPSGVMQEVPTELSTPEIQARIADELKKLQEFTAYVIIKKSISLIAPSKPVDNISEQEFQQRLQDIQAQNLADRYLRLRADVEADVMTAQQLVHMPLVQPIVNPRHAPKKKVI